MKPVNRINLELKTPATNPTILMNGKHGKKPTKASSTIPNPAPLSKAKEEEFRKLDAIVQHDLSSSLEAAKAIFTMDEKQLFRGHGDSLKGYAESIDISAGYATHLKQAGEVYSMLEPAWKNGGPKPKSAGQLRCLWRLKDDAALMRSAWDDAVRRSRGKSPKTKLLQESVAAAAPAAKPLGTKSIMLRLNIGSVPGLAEELARQAQMENRTIEDSALALFAAFVEVKSDISEIDYEEERRIQESMSIQNEGSQRPASPEIPLAPGLCDGE